MSSSFILRALQPVCASFLLYIIWSSRLWSAYTTFWFSGALTCKQVYPIFWGFSCSISNPTSFLFQDFFHGFCKHRLTMLIFNFPFFQKFKWFIQNIHFGKNYFTQKSGGEYCIAYSTMSYIKCDDMYHHVKQNISNSIQKDVLPYLFMTK